MEIANASPVHNLQAAGAVEGIGHRDTHVGLPSTEADQAAPVIRTCDEEYILRVSNACSDRGRMVARGGGAAEGQRAQRTDSGRSGPTAGVAERQRA